MITTKRKHIAGGLPTKAKEKKHETRNEFLKETLRDAIDLTPHSKGGN